MEFKIGEVEFNNSNCVIIAEAGVNHLGDLAIAEELIAKAALAGADIIKFQTYKAKDLTTKNAPRFWNWDGEENKEGSQYDSYSILDKFNQKEYEQLIKLCKKYKIEFLSTPFSVDAAKMLNDIGMSGYKIASCDITNIPLLKEIAKFGKPMLISTGASNIDEIKIALNEIHSVNDQVKICIMHCILCYPTEFKDANILMINDLKNTFPQFLIGLSDHTIGIHSPLSTIPLGVRVIEKHYTIDKGLPKSADHWLSIDDTELKDLKKISLDIMDSLGQDVKDKIDCEDKTHKYARRSIVSTSNIKKGEKFSKNNLACKRPGIGLSPALIDKIFGKIAKSDIEIDSLIQEDHIDW